MNVSADGFISRPDGDIGLGEPDEELHRFWNEQTRGLGAHLLGRRLYETMAVWEDYEQTFPSAPQHALEFAPLWREVPKVVFSRTLDRVEGTNTRLAEGDVADEVRRVKEQPGGDIAVGGAELAAALMRADLIDQYAPVVHPVVHGGGVPFWPPLDAGIELRLVETRTFGIGAVLLRYERARP
jgi:dihydrofolate reductase